MAINGATVWEVRPANGNSSNGGGFRADLGGTDRSNQNAAHVVIDDATISAAVMATTTRLQLTGYTVDASDVGNVVQNVTGTGTKGYFQITAIDAGSNYWTLDRAAGTEGQTFIGNMGGALTGLNQGVTKLQAVAVAGNIIHIKKEAGWAEDIAISANQVVIIGYNATRGDAPTGANRPRNNGGGGTATFAFASRSLCSASNLILAGGTQRAYNGDSTVACKLINCRMCNSAGTGAQGNTGATAFIECEFDGNLTNGAQDTSSMSVYVDCSAHHNGDGAGEKGFLSQSGVLVNCFAFCNYTDGFGNGAYTPATPIVLRSLFAAQPNGMSPVSPTLATVLRGNVLWGNTTYGATSYVPGQTGCYDYNDFSDNGTETDGGSLSAHDRQLAPGYADLSKVDITDLAIGAGDNTTVTSTAHPFTAADVGKYLRIMAGTNFSNGGYYILGVDGSNVATLDAACGTAGATGGTAERWTMDFTGGAALAGLGYPPNPIGATVAYPPIGPIQSQTGAGGAGGGGPLVGGRLVN